MTQSISFKQLAFVFGLPLLIIISSIVLATSQAFLQNPSVLAMGITYDLTILTPLLFLLLIWKKPIPKLAVVPFFVGGILLTSFLLPEAYHFHLNGIKTYLLPLVEVTVGSVLVYKVYQVRQSFKSIRHPDLLTRIRSAYAQVFQNPLIAGVMSTEMAWFYYAFFYWKKPVQTKSEFSSYRENGLIAIYIALMAILLIEMVAIHLLVAQWSVLVAWILTASTLYVWVILIAHIKALSRRFTCIEADSLEVRAGLFGDASIVWADIEKVELSTTKPKEKGKVAQAAMLGELEGHNVVIWLKQAQKLQMPYGMQKSFEILLIYVDDKARFMEVLNRHIQV